MHILCIIDDNYLYKDKISHNIETFIQWSNYNCDNVNTINVIKT